MKFSLCLLVAAATMVLARPLEITENTVTGAVDVTSASNLPSTSITKATSRISKRGIGDFLNGVFGHVNPTCDTSTCRCCILLVATCWDMPVCTKPPYPGSGHHDTSPSKDPPKPVEPGKTIEGVSCLPRGGGCFRADGSPIDDGF